MLQSIKYLQYFLLTLFIHCQLCNAEEQVHNTEGQDALSIYHLKDGLYVKRGEITGLHGIPEYVPAKTEIVDFKDAKDPFYHVKIKNERTGDITLSSVKVCQLISSEWRDQFTLHLNEDNEYYYFDYYSASDDCAETIQWPVTNKPFTSYIRVVKPAQGPKPKSGNFASQKKTKPSVQVNDEIPSDEVEEKSFYQKYWLYILGAVMLLITMNGPAPETPSRPPAQ
ncbi:hypothetical protein BDB01DRAFT_341117 [Pilobolus umbonatus]|nr:hypothetical protein BDB01DRAFT_341117 [Pilobolus umbonatus]